MKLEALFEVKHNKLVKIDDTEFVPKLTIQDCKLFLESSNEISNLIGIKLHIKKIKLSDGIYDEEILSKLRTRLKQMEESSNFAFIIPYTEDKITDADKADDFIKVFVHTARRIKDCKNFIGFEIPECLMENDSGKPIDSYSWSEWFVSEMNVKHPNYVYFADSKNVDRVNLRNQITHTSYILY